MLVIVLDLLRREGVLRIDMIVVTIVVVLVLRKAKSISIFIAHTLTTLLSNLTNFLTVSVSVLALFGFLSHASLSLSPL